MTHLLDKDLLTRANAVLMLGIVGGGLVLCAVASLVHDVGRLFQLW